MNLNELSPVVAKKARKRIGRGNASGQGKTAGKGSNGQKSRSGSYIHPKFEGGQLPLVRRVPKIGFSNYAFRKDYEIINLVSIEERFEAGATVTPDALVEVGLIKNTKGLVKILANGELTKKVTVVAHKVSAEAKAKIEAVGGSIELLAVGTFADVAGNAKK